MRSLEVFSTVKRAAEFGVTASDTRLDWQKVQERKDEIIKELVGDREADLKEAGIAYYREEASFLSRDELLIGGKRFRARRVVIAGGSRPSKPPIPGIEYAITSDQALELRTLPESMVIIGGGYIALELGYVFSAAGVDLTILEATERLLPNADGEISRAIERSFVQRGVGVHTSATVTGIALDNSRRVVKADIGGSELSFYAETVLVATGRGPNLDGLNLDAADIRYSKKGIDVNDFLQTSASSVYAAGDITGTLMLTPVASYQARIAARNAIEGNVVPADYRIVPSAVFTYPSIAWVGMTEEQARAENIDHSVSHSYFQDNGAAVINGEPEGFVKLIADSEGRIIGGHIIGAGAPDAILEVAVAMKGKLTMQALSDTIHIHPSFSFAVARAAASYKGDSRACNSLKGNSTPAG